MLYLTLIMAYHWSKLVDIDALQYDYVGHNEGISSGVLKVLKWPHPPWRVYMLAQYNNEKSPFPWAIDAGWISEHTRAYSVGKSNIFLVWSLVINVLCYVCVSECVCEWGNPILNIYKSWYSNAIDLWWPLNWWCYPELCQESQCKTSNI